MTVRDAVAWIKSPPAYRQVANGATGLCLRNVREAFGIAARYSTAVEAGRAQQLYDGNPKNSAPRNRPYFWSGGSSGAGHIAITDGYTMRGNLRVWTTDWPNPFTGHADGKWRRVNAKTITARWGLHPMGYGETLNGVALYK